MNNMITKLLLSLTLLCIAPLVAEELELSIAPELQKMHTVHFNDVPVIELIRYVSKVSDLNFIYDQQDLKFKISLVGSKPLSTEALVKSMASLLSSKGFIMEKEKDCFIIRKNSQRQKPKEAPVIEIVKPIEVIPVVEIPMEPLTFSVYKLKYHQGGEIEGALKKIAAESALNKNFSQTLYKAIQSLQWVKTTNSLLFSADHADKTQLVNLINSLDVPLRQVFIEVLVIETDARKSSEFGLQWGAGGVLDGRIGFGGASTIPGSAQMNGSQAFSKAMQSGSAPTGLAQLPLVGGFDMGVIGDVIMHKGRSFLTLGALVSAIEGDTNSTIVLNQKIITQDNKNSTIFVGDNIPFTGSVIQTVGQSQQTTANIEYRDVGVKLSITPMLGEGNVITLDINQEITESLDHYQPNNSNVNGIRTTKTNMVTHVHVPDEHFLVLSGMIRNAALRQNTAVPCLGGLPLIGAAFSHSRDKDEKRNIIIFVRPRIINSFDEYQKVTQGQQAITEAQSGNPNLPKTIEAITNPG